MKILLVQETDWFEKGPLLQNHLMEKLSSRGHEVRVIDHEILWKLHITEGRRSNRRVYEHVSRLYEGADVTVIRPVIIRVPTLDYCSLIFSRRKEIAQQITEFKPDIILGFQILTPYIAASLALGVGIPFLYYWTDVYHSQIPFRLYQPLGRLIEKRTIKKSDMVVSMNEQLMNYTIKLGAAPALARIIRGSVDFERFRPEIDPMKVRIKYGIKKSDFVICFVGLFHRLLALDKVVIGLANRGNSKTKLLLVGEGDQHAPTMVEELSLLARKLGVQEQVILTGRRPYAEVPELMAAGDVCILPSYAGEMMDHIVPIKMYEYMAMQKPVISTRLPGVMAEFGVTNGVVYIDNPEDTVAQAIELASGDIVELGLKARKFVERHSWDSITDEFYSILKGLVEKRCSLQIDHPGSK